MVANQPQAPHGTSDHQVMGSSVDRELDLEESHGRIAVINDDENIRKQEEESFCTALQLVGSSVLPMSIQSAIELGVFDIIAKAGRGAKLSSSEIVAQIATENPEAPVMLDSILRFLASYSVLDCSVVAANDEFVRFYSLNRVSKHFMPNEDGVSLAPMVALGHGKVFSASWSQLKNAIVEGGRPFKRAHGLHLFEYTGSDPRFHQAFHAAMFNYAIIVMKKILQIYKGFEQLNKLVDVGGGLGHTLNLIISKYPHIKGINYDMPQVIKHVSPYPAYELGANSFFQVWNVLEEMFESVPIGDAIIMKWILHDWTDAQCLKLLKNCYNAIPNDGKVIVIEEILPVLPDTSTSVKCTSELNLVVMTQTPGGKERSREEFLALAIGAGFSGIRYECFTYNTWVMEFFK